MAAQEPYRTPPAIVQKILDAPTLPLMSASPDGSLLLLAERQDRPTIADLAQPMLRLAGRRINPSTNGTFATSREFLTLTLQNPSGGGVRPIAGPENADIGEIQWSPDGTRIAFTNTTASGIELWVVDVAPGEAPALTGPVLNGTLGRACTWMPGSAQLLCRRVPEGRGAAPQASPVPIGPIVQRNEGRPAPVRTYQDLLETPHDEALFA